MIAKGILTWVICLMAVCGASFAGGLEEEAAAQAPQFGPFNAVHIDSEIIQGVRVDTEDKIWIMLHPQYRNEELVLRISNEYKSSYRNWHHGSKDLISPANQGKVANEWTDWIRTTSNYIEYWMGDRLILHLKRR